MKYWSEGGNNEEKDKKSIKIAKNEAAEKPSTLSKWSEKESLMKYWTECETLRELT